MAKEIRGKALQVTRVQVSLDVVNNADHVCCDVWVLLGPSASPFPRNGGPIVNGENPFFYDGAVKDAPIKVEFVIGHKGLSFPRGPDTFSASYDFATQASQAYPALDNLKRTSNIPVDAKDGLYAQVFVWLGDPRDNVDVNAINLEVEGVMPKED